MGEGPFAQMHPFGATHPKASPNLALHLLTYNPCWIPHMEDELPQGEAAWREAVVWPLQTYGCQGRFWESDPGQTRAGETSLGLKPFSPRARPSLMQFNFCI